VDLLVGGPQRARRVAVVTVGRSDYGIYRPVLRRLTADPAFAVSIVAAAAHLQPELGRTIDFIVNDGFDIAEQVPMPADSDSPEAIARSSGAGTIGFARAYASLRPDVVLTLGDRFEMHAAVVAAVPLGIPVAHIHGGETTEGAIDELYRHSITKMSHLHFVATDTYARRVVQMGEQPSRVIVSGAPSLDALRSMVFLDRTALETQYGFRLDPPVAVVTFHPETRRQDAAEQQIRELVAALDGFDGTIVITAPNADAGRQLIGDRLRAFAARRASTWFVDALGPDAYFSVMTLASVMVGNSSSGIIEAPSFALPVVNIGDRQAGRLRAANVIDVAAERSSIADGIRRALAPSFRAPLAGMRNPYGDGHAAERIADTLASVALDHEFMTKRFHDLPA
jgi:UDP-hydrolysing UDP-N-acetyl-D-glucosamine 2-epimerase